MKKEEGKYEPTLVYRSLIVGLSRVRQYGFEKYGSTEDWRSTPSSRHFDAALRHLLAFMSGEERDEASMLSHLYHAAANVMFEIERREGLHAETQEKHLGSLKVSVKCPRCGMNEDYPAYGVWPCLNACGYFIEPILENRRTLMMLAHKAKDDLQDDH